MLTILIVDDNENSLYLLQKLLEGEGHQVVMARDGQEALDAARRATPQLIISDILMPVMDGFSLCREWKRDQTLRTVPFIFYTATYTEKKDEEFALSLGADCFIVKPQDPERLMAKVNQVIENTRNQSAIPVSPLEVNDGIVYKKYNEALVRKLEDKMNQLERSKEALEAELEQRREVEEALRLSEARYLDMFNTAPVPFFSISGEGRVARANTAAELFTGYELDELQGMKVTDLYPPETRERANTLLDRIVAGEPLWNEEMVYRRKDGELAYGLLSVRPILDESGTLLETRSVVVDVTRRTLAEKELSKSQDQLRHAQRLEAIGRLAGGVAHDFNNLLTIVTNYTEMMLQDLSFTDPRRDGLEAVLTAAMRATTLTRQLLVFSRQQVLQTRVLDLRSAIEASAKLLHRLIGEDIELAIELPDQPLSVKADPGQIEQIVMNLAVNARDAMPDGGSLTITADQVTVDEAFAAAHALDDPNRDFTRLIITDTGSGMDNTIIEHLFEPFFTTKPAGQGTGLGLAVVYGIVSQHNGVVTVESREGQGTTFKVHLPVCPLAPEPIQAPDPSTEVYQGSGQRVLLIEDDQAVREATSSILETNGFEVLKAAGLTEGLALFEQSGGHIDLVISDVVLSDGSGLELVEQILERIPDTRILLCSGYTDEKSQWPIITAKGYPFIHKPFTMTQLLKKIRETITGATPTE